jgi:hypothetical protein
MAKLLKKEITDSELAATGKSMCMVELGAGTMLPSIVLSAQFKNMTCIATDHTRLLPLMKEGAQLNDNPSNLLTQELKWGNVLTNLATLEKTIKQQRLPQINYIVAVE